MDMHCIHDVSSREMRLLLKQLCSLVTRMDKREEMVERVRTLADQLAALVTSRTTDDGETPNPTKILQLHLKCVLSNSEAIKGAAGSIIWQQWHPTSQFALPARAVVKS